MAVSMLLPRPGEGEAEATIGVWLTDVANGWDKGETIARPHQDHARVADV